MKTIAIITARGGSKRIPKKNIKKFSNKPIISYPIEAALESKLFDRVMVSTDSVEIAEIAQYYGAEVPFLRSDKTANDYAVTADVIEEVLSQYKCLGDKFHYFCCIYPTAPLITVERLKQAYEMLLETNADSIIPVVPFSFPPQRSYIIEDEKLKMKWPEYKNSRSQDLQTMYRDSGQFYFMKTASFIRCGSLITPDTLPLVLDELEAQDIDTETDWRLAELKFQLKNRKSED